MNGQAVNGQIVRDKAKQRAHVRSVQHWRTEISEEVALYTRHGGEPGKLIDGWIRNLTEDIDAQQRELWRDIVELHRLRAYRRNMGD